MCQCCFEVCLAFLVGLSQLMIYSSGLIFINMAHPDIPINLFLPHRTLREKQLRARSGMPGSRWESILQLVKERKKKKGGGIYTINALLTLKASRRWRKHTFRVIFSPHVRSYVFSPDTHTHRHTCPAAACYYSDGFCLSNNLTQTVRAGGLRSVNSDLSLSYNKHAKPQLKSEGIHFLTLTPTIQTVQKHLNWNNGC